ncbi:MAG: glutamine--tRNA ligase [Chloroflexi bacterium]|nr:glutamine--tRNA ligase [Chloroflexota bacterium]|tara:strand:- start:16156 stop:17838 length:1683 start_codon:yes stop_codon:yes gene_type:complete
MNNTNKDDNLENTEDFIREIISKDLLEGKYNQIITRFPPEPNGYMHIGHAKSAFVNFSLASENNGKCNLRFDDTNPSKEEEEFIHAFEKDLKWLGFDYGHKAYYSSDYFNQLYSYAIKLIKLGLAYVCDLSQDEIREYRGTLTSKGKNSPFRDRAVEENLDLFDQMKKGRFENGSRVLRAKIDMSSGNLNLRDPVIYRIMKIKHHRTDYKWCIYPTYDFAHGQSDSLEKITHSICTVEFEDHRPLYNWFIDKLDIYPSKQIEFARLNLSGTVMSKRKLSELVVSNKVNGWDDPRMPTISGMRRRGYPSEAILDFCKRTSITKRKNVVDLSLLEHCVRENLNKSAYRVMAVLNPIKVVIKNYPDDLVEEIDALNNPEDLSAHSRKVPFSKEIYIERDDFAEIPPPKFYRLTIGKEVRLRYAYIIKCVDVIKNERGEVIEIHCEYDPNSRGGKSADGRKVKGTIHWVSALQSSTAEIRIYDKLISEEVIDENDIDNIQLNPNSIKVLKNCPIEISLSKASEEVHYQFERLGYFILDSKDTKLEHLVFNRTVSLRDSWNKQKT